MAELPLMLVRLVMYLSLIPTYTGEATPVAWPLGLLFYNIIPRQIVLPKASIRK